MSLIALFQANAVAFAVATLFLGLAVGSFLNVVIHRLPVILDRDWRQQCQALLNDTPPTPSDPAADRYNLVVPRSRCPHCGHPITALENIPILSYLWLRGRCSACRARISPRYPLVELATGLLSAFVAWRLGFGWPAAAALVLTWSLIALTVIDYDHQLLPDVITGPLLWAGLLLNSMHMFTDLHAAVIGAAAGYMSLWLLYQGFRLFTGKEGMGYGDFKLFAAFGAWLGWQQLPVLILLASLVGAIVGITAILVLGRDRRLPIPFGPYLAAAGWIALFWGNDLTRLYLQLAKVGG